MNCPSCKRDFGYFYSFKILNPLRHKCPSCETILTAGSRGKITLGLSTLVGLMIAAVAIIMEEKKLWTTYDSILWFAIAFAVFVPPCQYLAWRWCRFQIKKQECKDA